MKVSLVLLLLLITLSIPLVIAIIRAAAYSDYVSAIDKKSFAGSTYYGIGFALIDMLKISFKTEKANKVREQAGVLFGKKYADFYLRVLYAQAYTYTIMVLYAIFFLACIVGGNDGIILVAVGLIVAIILYSYYIDSYKIKIEKLNIIYMMDFPNAVSTIALLVNGGMLLRDAWNLVANSSDAPLYLQMRKVVEDMNNGVSEQDAIFAFSNRCSTKEIRKFSSLISQAIERGGKDLSDSLIKQSDLLINEKRQLVLQEGEKASNKLMIPIALIFVGILVIVLVPIMSNMST